MLAAGMGKLTDGAGAALNAGGAVTDKATGGCFGFGGKKQDEESGPESTDGALSPGAQALEDAAAARKGFEKLYSQIAADEGAGPTGLTRPMISRALNR